LITNHKPRADADDYALWKRLLLIPFTQSFVDKPIAENEHKADSRLVEKLKAESAGILAWLIRGCLAWQREGLNPPESVSLATKTYQAEEDDLSQFIEDCCLVGPDYEVRGGPLYTAYKQWAENYGMKPAGNVVFGKRLGKRFEKRLSAGVIYSGIGLLTEPVSS
jgi:putative DNA primase/helicase